MSKAYKHPFRGWGLMNQTDEYELNFFALASPQLREKVSNTKFIQ